MVNIGGASFEMLKSYFIKLRKWVDALCFATHLSRYNLK